MEKIDTYNYQAWFLDFVEGRLDSARVSMLELFLAQYPQLAEELEEFENIGIQAKTVEYENKLHLKKGDILDSYIDEQCIAYIEGYLDKSEQLNFEKVLLENLETLNSLTKFEKTKLQFDQSIVFEKKNVLKHYEINNSLRKFVLSAAASIALIMGLVFVFKKMNQMPNTTQMVYETVDVKPLIVEPTIDINKNDIAIAQKTVRKENVAEREFISLNNLRSKENEHIALLEKPLEIESPVEYIDEKKLFLSDNIESALVEPENKEPEQYDNLLWLLANKSIAILNKYQLTNIKMRKEKDVAQQTTSYAFDTKWVSVYAYVNDEK